MHSLKIEADLRLKIQIVCLLRDPHPLFTNYYNRGRKKYIDW